MVDFGSKAAENACKFMASPLTKPIEKATIYMRDGLYAYSKIEVSNLTWASIKYAQYPNAVKLEYTERRKRKRNNAVITTFPAVILDGWEHPQPPPTFSAPMADTYSFKENRFDVLDERWDVEFDAFLDAHIKKAGATVLLDLRAHDPSNLTK